LYFLFPYSKEPERKDKMEKALNQIEVYDMPPIYGKIDKKKKNPT
jgi:hypothetical protein